MTKGRQQCTGFPCLPSWGLLLRSWTPGRPYPFLSQPSEDALSNPSSSAPEGKVQPLREARAGLRQTAENQVPQSRSNPKGLFGCAFCSLPLRYELCSKDPGEHLAKNEYRTHKTVVRGPRGNSPQLSWEQLDVSSRRWSVAISVLCSLTKWSVNSLLCGNVQTIAWENARVTFPSPPVFVAGALEMRGKWCL